MNISNEREVIYMKQEQMEAIRGRVWDAFLDCLMDKEIFSVEEMLKMSVVLGNDLNNYMKLFRDVIVIPFKKDI